MGDGVGHCLGWVAGLQVPGKSSLTFYSKFVNRIASQITILSSAVKNQTL